MTAKRIDANQNSIVDGLRKFGAWVYVTSNLGHGFVDAIAYYHGKFFLFEIKSGNGRLTEAEQKFRDDCPESYVIRTIEEAIDLLNWISEDE